MQHLNKLENEENLWKAFKTFDADGSGFITAEELVLALEVRTWSPHGCLWIARTLLLIDC